MSPPVSTARLVRVCVLYYIVVACIYILFIYICIMNMCE
jgi:hypothetical protein